MSVSIKDRIQCDSNEGLVAVIELRDHEARTLQALAKLGKPSRWTEVATETGLEEAAVMRAALALADRGYASIKDEPASLASLTAEGRVYAERGLPERRILKTVVDHGGRMEASEAARLAEVPTEMLPIVYGWLKKKGWAKLEKSGASTVIVSEKVAEAARDENVLRMLSESPETDLSKLGSANMAELQVLKQRRLLLLRERAEKVISITPEGMKLIEQGIAIQREVSTLTPEMLATGSWRQTKLNIWRMSGFARKLLGSNRGVQKTRITMGNGSVIEAFPNSPDTIRGPSFNVVWMEEANFVPNDEELYDGSSA